MRNEICVTFCSDNIFKVYETLKYVKEYNDRNKVLSVLKEYFKGGF